MRTPEDRFWEKVDVRGPDECWEWTASTTANGYGQMGWPRAGRRMGKSHRIAWEIANGPIPDKTETGEKACVLHTCDNPLCCNSAHLRLGSHAENNREKVVRKRQARGSNHGRTRLTEDLVYQIRSLCDQGWHLRDIGAAFGVHFSQVGRIGRREFWAHLPEATA